MYQITQAASQFNNLESINDCYFPLYKQVYDPTRCPTVCSQSLISWIKREAMYEDRTLPDSAQPILKELVQKEVIVWNEGQKAYFADSNFQETGQEGGVFYKNGYLQPFVLNLESKKSLARATAQLLRLTIQP